VPDPELIERPRRRQLSAEYKLGVVRRADACTRPGEIGALLRREGSYLSLLTEWQRARLGCDALSVRPPGSLTTLLSLMSLLPQRWIRKP